MAYIRTHSFFCFFFIRVHWSGASEDAHSLIQNIGAQLGDKVEVAELAEAELNGKGMAELPESEFNSSQPHSATADRDSQTPLVSMLFVKNKRHSEDAEDGTRALMNLSLPLHALPVVDAGVRIPRDSFAVGINSPPGMAAAADLALRQVAYIQRSLPANLTSDGFQDIAKMDDRFDPVTDRLDTEELRKEQVEAVKRMELVFAPLVDMLLEKVVTHVMDCPLAKLRCPRFNWYARINGGKIFDHVHNDAGLMLGLDEEQVNSEFGANMEDWFNIWMLLSDSVLGQPLVLLEPDNIVQKNRTNPFLWPPRDVPSFKPGNEDVLNAFTFANMSQGDIMVWRSTKVPHAAGKLVSEWAKAEASDPRTAPQAGKVAGMRNLLKRSSLDFRCVCTQREQKVVRTWTGELCRQTWKHQDKVFHGCANPDGDKHSWCEIERAHTGGEGCLREGEDDKCRGARYDYCGPGKPPARKKMKPNRRSGRKAKKVFSEERTEDVDDTPVEV